MPARLKSPASFLSLFLAYFSSAAVVRADTASPAAEVVETARSIVSLLAWLIILAVVAVVAVFVVRRLMHEAGTRKIKGIHEETMENAARFEEKGDFSSAAAMYEKLGDMAKAAALYERGKDFGSAARLYENMDQAEKAIDFYKRAGESLKAAELSMQSGKYVEAAMIFRNKGDRLRAARALEMAGNMLAAAKEYAGAGQYVQAARVYKDKGLYREAREMYLRSLGGEELGPSNLDKYYTYAALLHMEGQAEKAAGIFRGIVQIDPGFRDVTQRLASMAAREEKAKEEAQPFREEREVESVDIKDPAGPVAAEGRTETDEEARTAGADDIDSLVEGEPEKRDIGKEEEGRAAGPPPRPGEASLRGIMGSGRMDPNYGMKMWMQILRVLSEKHGNGIFFGCIAPEAVFIDMQNNVRIEALPEPVPVYTAPEVMEGSPPDEQSDIYAMGALLHELVTGSATGVAEKAPSAVAGDIPEWLDELVLRCTEKSREHRYKSLEEIYARLLELRDRI